MKHILQEVLEHLQYDCIPYSRISTSDDRCLAIPIRSKSDLFRIGREVERELLSRGCHLDFDIYFCKTEGICLGRYTGMGYDDFAYFPNIQYSNIQYSGLV